LGNFLIWVGLSLDLGTWWYSLIAALAFWFYYERIMLTEEGFLESRFGPEFLAWADRTPAFIPRLRGWQRPERPFSWRRVLRNEHPTLAALLLVYSILEIVSDLVTVHRVRLEPEWLIPLGVGLAAYLVLRILKKWTRVLQEA